jgi:D-3-phosphoglycerate dehydrogenase
MKTSFPKNRIRVLLVEGIHPVARQLLEEEGFRVSEQDKAPEPSALRRALREGDGVHIVGIRSKTQLDAAALTASPRLLAVGAFCIGVNQIDLDEASRRGVAVFNSPFSNTRSVAELTIAEIIALHRGLTGQNERMHRGQWDKSSAGAHEVRGRTLGIVGYGHIGSQVSILAEALGMRVIFHDIANRLPLGNARPCRTLGELLRAADVVSLHVPATPSTHHLIGREQIRLMRRGAFLINNARGSVVDVRALAEGVRSGHLAGAAADVFPHEPAGRGEPFRSELIGLPNVILTPHIAGSTEEAQENIARDVVRKILNFVNVGSTTDSVNLPQVDLPPQGGPDAPDAGEPGAAPRPRVRRFLHLHENQPGVMKRVNEVMARRGVNVAAQYLQTRGALGYVVMDLEGDVGPGLADELRAVEGTIRVRELL